MDGIKIIEILTGTAQKIRRGLGMYSMNSTLNEDSTLKTQNIEQIFT
jgi:hypothetical protein